MMDLDLNRPLEVVESTTRGSTTRRARVVATDVVYGDLSDCVLVLAETDRFNGTTAEVPYVFFKDGKGVYQPYTLRNVKVKKEGWVNVYRNNYGRIFFGMLTPYGSEEEARESSTTRVNKELDHLGTIKVEWEE